MKHLVSSTDKIAAVSQVKLNYDQQKSSGKNAAMKTEGEWATRTGKKKTYDTACCWKTLAEKIEMSPSVTKIKIGIVFIHEQPSYLSPHIRQLR